MGEESVFIDFSGWGVCPWELGTGPHSTVAGPSCGRVPMASKQIVREHSDVSLRQTRKGNAEADPSATCTLPRNQDTQ